ncbi:uncharacterized protein CC84DRAFT_901948 [Paraphaeosphaeria sporulosa]|uniref:Uncharacterized protein n=1 Tax=Paraphaeosphaeria sporulosa TaxID=1460663 RepID=A0A177C7D4_9PLEO|nr:uncharacterized protein CC84DRAFT_901948 [Paraphaeosphaeria sporulosa]OAG02610.1 hypothetical protein CC84DRAFT_901948 [Paraphaeosphaeria sporulosa]
MPPCSLHCTALPPACPASASVPVAASEPRPSTLGRSPPPDRVQPWPPTRRGPGASDLLAQWAAQLGLPSLSLLRRPAKGVQSTQRARKEPVPNHADLASPWRHSCDGLRIALRDPRATRTYDCMPMCCTAHTRIALQTAD